MKDTVQHAESKGEPCDYGDTFKALSPAEKRGILKTARTLLKTQREAALLAGGFVFTSAEKGTARP